MCQFKQIRIHLFQIIIEGMAYDNTLHYLFNVTISFLMIIRVNQTIANKNALQILLRNSQLFFVAKIHVEFFYKANRIGLTYITQLHISEMH